MSALLHAPALLWFSMAAVDFGFAGMYWFRVEDEAMRRSDRRRSRRLWCTPWWSFGSAAVAAKGLTMSGCVFVVLGIYKLFGG